MVTYNMSALERLTFEGFFNPIHAGNKFLGEKQNEKTDRNQEEKN